MWCNLDIWMKRETKNLLNVSHSSMFNDFWFQRFFIQKLLHLIPYTGVGTTKCTYTTKCSFRFFKHFSHMTCVSCLSLIICYLKGAAPLWKEILRYKMHYYIFYNILNVSKITTLLFTNFFFMEGLKITL